MVDMQKNKKFYDECTSYFEYLRNKGIKDDEFEDEFFYTMPAISNTS